MFYYALFARIVLFLFWILSVLPFFDGLNLLTEVCVSSFVCIICISIRGFKLTKSLKATFSERMSRKLDMSIKGSN